MKIANATIIEVAGGNKFCVVVVKKIDGVEYCLLSTMDAPIEMRVAELRTINDNTEIKNYDGADYKNILLKLLDGTD